MRQHPRHFGRMLGMFPNSLEMRKYGIPEGGEGDGRPAIKQSSPQLFLQDGNRVRQRRL